MGRRLPARKRGQRNTVTFDMPSTVLAGLDTLCAEAQIGRRMRVTRARMLRTLIVMGVRHKCIVANLYQTHSGDKFCPLPEVSIDHKKAAAGEK